MTVWLFSLPEQHSKYVHRPFHLKKLFPAIGTKGVARDMKKVCSGAQRDEGKTWFSELSDKGTGMNFELSVFVSRLFFFFYLQSKFLL